MLSQADESGRPCFLRFFFVFGVLLGLMVLPMSGLSQKTKEAGRTDPPIELLQNIFDGLAQGDFSKYSRDFSPAMKEVQTRENFLDLQKKVQSSLGKLKTTNYFGYYVQRGNHIHLFKARFSKEKDDVLVKLVLDSNKPTGLVTGLWMDSPALDK